MSRALALWIAVLTLFLWSPLANADSESGHEERIKAELGVVAKTQDMVSDKLLTREGEMRGRVRAMYKLSRSSFPRLWFEPVARREVARWLGAARRITSRDIHELALLREELDVATHQEKRLRIEGTRMVPAVPGEGSLLWPVAEGKVARPFGDYKFSKRVRLRRRGIELSAKKGRTVQAPAAGRIRYVGPISGLGTTMIIDLDDEGCWIILGRLRNVALEVGDKVEAGSAIAQAAGTRVYLELRLAVGQTGQAIDPEPYFD